MEVLLDSPVVLLTLSVSLDLVFVASVVESCLFNDMSRVLEVVEPVVKGCLIVVHGVAGTKSNGELILQLLEHQSSSSDVTVFKVIDHFVSFLSNEVGVIETSLHLNKVVGISHTVDKSSEKVRVDRQGCAGGGQDCACKNLHL